MSTAIEALIERELFVLGMNTYGVVQRLYDDYHQSLREFRDRSEQDLLARQGFADREATASADAAAIAALTTVTPADSSEEFVAGQLAQLEQRITAQPAAEPELVAQCHALRQAIADAPGETAGHLEQYRLLAEAFVSSLAKHPQMASLSTPLADALALLREEINAPLLADAEFTATREELLAQLAVLEQLGVRQIALANQGVAVLSQRVHREMKRVLESRTARQQAAEEIRALTGESLAKLQALTHLPDVPAYAEQAQLLLTRLPAVLEQPTADTLVALRQFYATVESLYAACANALAGQAAASYVSDQVSDILSSLGYHVTQVAGEGDAPQQCLANINDTVGVQFEIDQTGRFGAHMVAFDESGATNGAQYEEKVCSLVDEVFTALRQRHCPMRERYRMSLAAGERLAIVEIPHTDEQPAHTDTAPKQMRIDQP